MSHAFRNGLTHVKDWPDMESNRGPWKSRGLCLALGHKRLSKENSNSNKRTRNLIDKLERILNKLGRLAIINYGKDLKGWNLK